MTNDLIALKLKSGKVIYTSDLDALTGTIWEDKIDWDKTRKMQARPPKKVKENSVNPASVFLAEDEPKVVVVEPRMGKETYKKKYNYECMNPACLRGSNPETHHIVPRKHGGADVESNYIILCQHCHDTLHVHRDWETTSKKLYLWKFAGEAREVNLA
jgi:5-methylcytosine-specific restriction endonuclease McrA